jgi:GxxExxY protein
MRTNKCNKSIIYAEDSYKLVGIAMEIHRTLGNIYQEKHYQKLFEEKLKTLCIPFEREKKLTIKTKEGLEIGEFFADFVINNKILLELKRVNFIHYNDIKQVLRYLDATGLKLGIIVNFKLKRLEYKRVVNPRFDKNIRSH